MEVTGRQHIAFVAEFQGEKRVRFRHQSKEDPVPFPARKFRYILFRDPHEVAFGTLLHVPLPVGTGPELQVLPSVLIGAARAAAVLV